MSGYLIYCVEKSVIGLITAYLAYKSVANKSVEDSVEVRKSILSLFIFFGLFTIIESTIEPFLFWLPFYYEAKCVILLIVSVLSLYYHSLFLNRVILDPLFQQFDVHVAPRLVKYTNDLLYYAVVIVSPFVSYAQLERMEEYILSAKKAMYGDSAAS
ncbi:hypothetical protein AV274_3324 [Blastocystis sp. ATCC 50177/Nand II]|uniref:Uncharacterized protein n=1 Tax=Blastocystis sp. subtype 1 (strain ATCC 50177 / NandII) TaxID=478820 RepID=A0A196SFQ3_BLAHN|nr:hypothetical protein AV274_3324 [Blastocystis sp. ATCC 50177/Nand II]